MSLRDASEGEWATLGVGGEGEGEKSSETVHAARCSALHHFPRIGPVPQS